MSLAGVIQDCLLRALPLPPEVPSLRVLLQQGQSRGYLIFLYNVEGRGPWSFLQVGNATASALAQPNLPWCSGVFSLPSRVGCGKRTFQGPPWAVRDCCCRRNVVDTHRWWARCRESPRGCLSPQTRRPKETCQEEKGQLSLQADVRGGLTQHHFPLAPLPL